MAIVRGSAVSEQHLYNRNYPEFLIFLQDMVVGIENSDLEVDNFYREEFKVKFNYDEKWWDGTYTELANLILSTINPSYVESIKTLTMFVNYAKIYNSLIELRLLISPITLASDNLDSEGTGNVSDLLEALFKSDDEKEAFRILDLVVFKNTIVPGETRFDLFNDFLSLNTRLAPTDPTLLVSISTDILATRKIYSNHYYGERLHTVSEDAIELLVTVSANITKYYDHAFIDSAGAYDNEYLDVHVVLDEAMDELTVHAFLNSLFEIELSAVLRVARALRTLNFDEKYPDILDELANALMALFGINNNYLLALNLLESDIVDLGDITDNVKKINQVMLDGESPSEVEAIIGNLETDMSDYIGAKLITNTVGAQLKNITPGMATSVLADDLNYSVNILGGTSNSIFDGLLGAKAEMDDLINLVTGKISFIQNALGNLGGANQTWVLQLGDLLGGLQVLTDALEAAVCAIVSILCVLSNTISRALSFITQIGGLLSNFGDTADALLDKVTSSADDIVRVTGAVGQGGLAKSITSGKVSGIVGGVKGILGDDKGSLFEQGFHVIANSGSEAVFESTSIAGQFSDYFVDSITNTAGDIHDILLGDSCKSTASLPNFSLGLPNFTFSLDLGFFVPQPIKC